MVCQAPGRNIEKGHFFLWMDVIRALLPADGVALLPACMTAVVGNETSY